MSLTNKQLFVVAVVIAMVQAVMATTYKICLAEASHDTPAGWCLAAHGTNSKDFRDSQSSYLFVVRNEHNWAAEWSLTETAPGQGEICLAEASEDTPAGWCLAAHAADAGTDAAGGALAIKDSRNSDSSYAFVVRDANDWPATWRFNTPFGSEYEEGMNTICLAEANQDTPAGWCLAAHGSMSKDFRNSDSSYAFVVRDANDWPAQWVLVKSSSSLDTAAAPFTSSGNSFAVAGLVGGVSGAMLTGLFMMRRSLNIAVKQPPLFA